MADLNALAAVASGDGAEILAFQIEMLDDPALIDDAWPLIDDGESAEQAWQAGLDAADRRVPSSPMTTIFAHAPAIWRT